MATEVYVSKAPMCDVHRLVYGVEIIPATYDGRTVDGPWANMCDACWDEIGCGMLGTGNGQRIIVGPEPVRDRKAEVRAAMDREDVTLSEIEDIVGDGDLADFL